MINYKYLDGVTMPSDPNASLGSLRRELRIVYNGSRTPERAERMALLRDTLVFVVGLIDEAREQESEKPAPQAADRTEPEVETPARVARRPKRKPKQ